MMSGRKVLSDALCTTQQLSETVNNRGRVSVIYSVGLSFDPFKLVKSIQFEVIKLY